MKLEIEEINNPLLISSYGDNSFKINNINYAGSIIISDKKKIISIKSKETIYSNPFITFIINSNACIDLLVFGTGNELFQLPEKLYDSIIKKNINVEVMKTSSACRTWNVLTSENRRIAAIFKAVN